LNNTQEILENQFGNAPLSARFTEHDAQFTFDLD